ncbi:MAG: hypothetical protein ACM30G_06230 [Micromonosporaceae bacterium]
MVGLGLVLVASGGCERARPPSGLENKSAEQVQQEAAAALNAAGSVHVTGTIPSQGGPLQVDLRLQGNASSGTVGVNDVQFEITAIGDDFYLKGDQAAWAALQAPPAVDGAAGRWVKLRSTQVKLDLLSLDAIAAQLTDNAWRLAPTVRQETVNGHKVVVLSQPDGSTLSVANSRPAHVVRIDDKKSNGWQIDFTEQGVDFHLAPPVNALSNTITATELAWLGAVSKLATTMTQIFQNAPRYLTPSVTAALSQQLGECRRELKRIGSPSQRLQEVYALTAQACDGYDKGAECFATAARIGIPLAGTAAARRLDAALDCGFAASASDVPLIDAAGKGQQLKAQLS